MKEPTLQDWKDAMSRLVQYRMKAMGLTTEDLAERSGLPFNYVHRVVEADVYPSHKARQLLAPALGCNLEHVEPNTPKT